MIFTVSAWSRSLRRAMRTAPELIPITLGKVYQLLATLSIPFGFRTGQYELTLAD